MATGFVSSVENSRTGVKSNVDGSRSSAPICKRLAISLKERFMLNRCQTTLMAMSRL